jgi:hypothetical protein
MQSAMTAWLAAMSIRSWRVSGMQPKRGVVVLMDRMNGRDRTVSRLVDAPWLSGIHSGEWETFDLVDALQVAMRRAPDRLVASVAMADACRRLVQADGPVTVRRAYACEGIRRIRLRS